MEFLEITIITISSRNVKVKINNNMNYYVFHGRVTLFFANNSSMQCRITMKLSHNFF